MIKPSCNADIILIPKNIADVARKRWFRACLICWATNDLDGELALSHYDEQ